MHKKWLTFGWLLALTSIGVFLTSATVAAQEFTESPHVFMIEADHCLNETASDADGSLLIRKQTGFRVKGTAGIVTALHGIVDCESISAISESKEGEAFADLEIVDVDIDRDVARLLPKGTSEDEATTMAKIGFDVVENDTPKAYEGLYLIGHPYGARAQYTTEKITLRKTSTDTLALLLPSSLTLKLRERNSPDPDLDVLSIEGNLVPGHSGAPVLNNKNQVVGVGDGGLGNEISWLIPWQKIRWQSYYTVWRQLNQLKKQNPSEIFFDVIDIKNNSLDYIVYRGRVLDTQGNFVDRAQVILDLNGESHIVYTDSAGKFEIIGDAKKARRGRIYIKAEGYNAFNQFIDLVIAERDGLEFLLHQSSLTSLSCSFGFRVIDEKQNPISYAHVKVRYRLDVVDSYANSDGEFRGEIPCDRLTPLVIVEVSAQGYQAVEKNYTLIETLIVVVLKTESASTGTPTILPTLTSTPKPTTPSTQLPLIQFKDDFEQDIDPNWIQSDAITTINGKLTLLFRNEPDWIVGSLMLDQQIWTEYRLSVEVNLQEIFAHTLRREVDIFVHYQDENNYLVLVLSDAFDERPTSWFAVVDGIWIEHKLALLFYPSHSQIHIEVEVKGNSLITSFDEKVVDIWTNAPFASGNLGLLLKTKGVEPPWLDNYVIESDNQVPVILFATPTATSTPALQSKVEPIPVNQQKIIITGIGFAPSNETNQARRKQFAIKSADTDAKRNFAEWQAGAELDSVTVVENGEINTDKITLEIRAKIRGGTIIDQSYDDTTGTAEVTREYVVDTNQ